MIRVCSQLLLSVAIFFLMTLLPMHSLFAINGIRCTVEDHGETHIYSLERSSVSFGPFRFLYRNAPIQLVTAEPKVIATDLACDWDNKSARNILGRCESEQHGIRIERYKAEFGPHTYDVVEFGVQVPGISPYSVLMPAEGCELL